MDWIDGMNRALDYLEAHLEDSADIGEAARLAYSSRFHFQRMFFMLCGATVADYVRGRRLTLAAQELALGGTRVLDAALKYGYETPESFAKAFRRFHGVTPSEARTQGVTLRSLPRLKFVVAVKGETNMDYRIVKREAFRIVGRKLRVRTDNGENFTKIPEFWTQCNQDGATDMLCGISDDASCLGVCAEFSRDMTEFSYFVAVPCREAGVPEGCVEFTVPDSTWAVFDAVGRLPGSIQTVTQRVFAEWFPASAFEHADAPELEVYPPGDTASDNYRCEVWMPVVKKQ